MTLRGLRSLGFVIRVFGWASTGWVNVLSKKRYLSEEIIQHLRTDAVRREGEASSGMQASPRL